MSGQATNDNADRSVVTRAFTAFADIPLAVFVAAADDSIQYANTAFYRLVNPDSSSDRLCHGVADLELLFGINLRNHLRAIMATESSRHIDPFAFIDHQGRLYYLSISISRAESNLAVAVIYDLTESSEAKARVERHVRELRIIQEISQALHSTMKSDEILRIILAGATCKEGLGFNRAFLFLKVQEADALIGKMAIGPSTPEEAGLIWARMNSENRTLSEVLQRYLQNVDQCDIEVNRLVRSMRIDLVRENLFSEVVEKAQAININYLERFDQASKSEALRSLGVVWCAIVPVVSRGDCIGVIVADNHITGRPVEDGAVRLLQVFASHAATAIEHARLFQEVAHKAQSLEIAQKTLARVQQQINAIERISLASEISHKIAHEIRNPLTIIGGFAGLLMSKLDPADKLREHAKIIVEETTRLENAMTDVLNFSRSFALEKETVDLGDICRGTIDAFLKRHPDRSAVLVPAGHPAQICVNRDQAAQSLYDVLDRMESVLPPNVAIRLETRSSDHEHRIDIRIDCQDQGESTCQRALVEAFDSELQGSSLKMTLAFETIRFNGGQPGIEIDDSGNACIYIAYPILEEQYV